MSSSSSCSCVGWIEKYFNDCVCNTSSEISFGLGLISLLCWGVAEIPQIITNFQAKSCNGVSVSFLLAWTAGDIFNLIGCHFEPVTLPTQYYTALLYTSTTVILFLQTLYYNYCRRWWKGETFDHPHQTDDHQVLEDERKPINQGDECSSIPIKNTPPTYVRASPRTDIYYMSARSLASSGTPPFGSSYYLGTARSGPSEGALHDIFSSDEEDVDDSPRSSTSHRRSSARPSRAASRSVGYGTFLVGSVSLPFHGKALLEAQMGLSRKLILQETRSSALRSNPYGLLFGWIMAAIYMGGRLPQIYLNIKRGSVEGLNPLMFLFALIANATYVGSILARSIEWEKIKANAPWLLDAVVCVVLDLFIIIQFTYFKIKQERHMVAAKMFMGTTWMPKSPIYVSHDATSILHM